MLQLEFYMILEEKWHKLRANIHQSVPVQFGGLAELEPDWLYVNI